MSAADKGEFLPDYIIVPGNVLRDPDLSPSAKLVYGRLRLYAGKDGRCFMKHQTLAPEVCLSVRQVRYMLEELRAAGWIKWRRGQTTCAYTVFPDRQDIADQDRQDIADQSGSILPTEIGRILPTEKKSLKSSSKRRSEKKNPPCSKTPAPPEEEKPKPFFSLNVDDEKPKPRTPFENPEMEFRARITERHGSVVDVDQLLRDVKSELDCGPLSEFLEADLKATTAPDKLSNPHGHYRKLARKVMRQKQAAGPEWTPIILQIPQPKFVPSCTCNDGKLPDGAYCGCNVGDTARQFDARFGRESQATAVNGAAP